MILFYVKIIFYIIGNFSNMELFWYIIIIISSLFFSLIEKKVILNFSWNKSHCEVIEVLTKFLTLGTAMRKWKKDIYIYHWNSYDTWNINHLVSLKKKKRNYFYILIRISIFHRKEVDNNLQFHYDFYYLKLIISLL